MKLPRKTNKKKLLIIAAAVIVLLGGATTAAYFSHMWPFNHSSSINMKPATKEQKDAGQKIKQNNANQEADNTTPNSKPTGSDQPAPPTPQPNGKSVVTMSITAANQNGSLLQIRSLIEIVNSSGTCTLTLSKAGASSVVKTAGIQPLASSSTCQGFDVPVSQLSQGIWSVDLVFENNSLRGETSTTVDIH